MNRYLPRRVLISERVWDGPIARNLRMNLPEHVPVVRVTEEELHSRTGLSDRRVLEVIEFKGRFLRSCPATRFYHCCGYIILHFGENCSVGCTYCILQAYLNRPTMTIFGNVRDMLCEVAEVLSANPDLLFRIGTGEFTDSLLLDPWTGLSEFLVPFFAGKENAVLELKTKTDHYSRLLDLNHNGHTIVSWSLNAPSISVNEESRAASLEDRLRAARSCAERGYFLAFHFDPLFYFPGWEKEYAEVVQMIGDMVPVERVVYVSLGGFRYMPELKDAILLKRPSWKLISGEFVPSPDGKRRYFRDIRIKLYHFMASQLRKLDPSLCIYLCMESGFVWKKALGIHPAYFGGLPAMLDRAVKERMKVGQHCRESAAKIFLKKPQPLPAFFDYQK
ncbi:SPL family radical SAM protein [Thermodesulforhabdus norvegica]|uniref:Spore photoproduct lyase n=1 Tax=Thermodesulforhabdus norvegica TaxID=39841 RepID=A0A1I4TC94_9BACT|nr:DNA photolyase [Thermodesulforhabdus norvegica]SFM74275.1 spore photoproduct lyase [Thermodesulforhabdus norvegica]